MPFNKHHLYLASLSLKFYEKYYHLNNKSNFFQWCRSTSFSPNKIYCKGHFLKYKPDILFSSTCKAFGCELELKVKHQFAFDLGNPCHLSMKFQLSQWIWLRSKPSTQSAPVLIPANSHHLILEHKELLLVHCCPQGYDFMRPCFHLFPFSWVRGFQYCRDLQNWYKENLNCRCLQLPGMDLKAFLIRTTQDYSHRPWRAPQLLWEEAGSTWLQRTLAYNCITYPSDIRLAQNPGFWH